MGTKRNLLIYLDYADTLFSELEDAEVGALIRAVMKYAKTDEREQFKDRLMQTVYSRMINDFENDMQKYEDRCEKNRAAANKRWTNANGYERIQANAKDAHNDNENHKDNENDNENPNHKPWRGEDVPDIMRGVI